MAEPIWTGFLRWSLVSSAVRLAPAIAADGKWLTANNDNLIEVDEFVPRAQIDQPFLGEAYYLYADSPLATDALEALRVAMAHAGRVALGHVSSGEGAQPVLIEPYGAGLLLVRLNFEEERNPTAFPERPEGAISREMIEIAEDIIQRRAADFDPRRLARARTS
jgi:DNA end-binding protein Ku